MSEHIKKFVDDLSNGKNADAGEAFKDALRAKVADGLDKQNKAFNDAKFVDKKQQAKQLQQVQQSHQSHEKDDPRVRVTGTERPNAVKRRHSEGPGHSCRAAVCKVQTADGRRERSPGARTTANSRRKDPSVFPTVQNTPQYCAHVHTLALPQISKVACARIQTQHKI